VVRRSARPLVRIAAGVVGATLPLLGGGVASADLPQPPGLPQSGQPITLVIEPPSLVTVSVPPAPTGCVIDTSFDNTSTSPPGSVFRGQSACGSEVYAPVLTGSVELLDVFGNVVATGNAFNQVGGVATAQGLYAMQGSVTDVGSGPIPGLDYTIRYDTSITLTAPQFWGPPAAGCSVNGQTLQCTVTSTYSYIPGTQGGITPD
jgi:hypothetical protein